MDVIAIVTITLITVPIVEFTQGAPRIILGVIVLLFFPGYTFTTALFPAKRNLKGIERAGLTFIMSLALVSLTGLALNYTPWGIRLNPIVISVTVLIILLSVISLVRRRRLSEEERFTLRVNIHPSGWATLRAFDKGLYIALAIVVIGALSTLGYVIARPKPEENFTNFYILGQDGMMENYPSTISINGHADVTLGIENYENGDSLYIVKIIFDSQEVQTIGPLTLADREKWSGLVSLVPSRTG